MSRDFVEMLFALCDGGVEFLVVGAHALAVHARPRATGDLDIWVRPTPENAQRVLDALGRFGASVAGLQPEDLTQPDQVYQIGVVPNRIDILTSLSGVSFDEAWPRRVDVQIESRPVPVIGRDDLIRNKEATGRTQDRADLEILRASRPIRGH